MEQKKKKSKYTLFMCNPPTKRRRETITRFRWQSESNSIWTTTTKNRFIDSTFACPQWPGPASSGQGGREDAWTLVQTCFQKGQQQKRRESGACSIEQASKQTNINCILHVHGHGDHWMDWTKDEASKSESAPHWTIWRGVNGTTHCHHRRRRSSRFRWWCWCGQCVTSAGDQQQQCPGHPVHQANEQRLSHHNHHNNNWYDWVESSEWAAIIESSHSNEWMNECNKQSPSHHHCQHTELTPASPPLLQPEMTAQPNLNRRSQQSEKFQQTFQRSKTKFVDRSI